MQEIKTLMLRVGSVANLDEFVFDGPMTDAHIQGYLNRGFTLFSVHPGNVDQTTSSVSTMYTLIRERTSEKRAQTVEDMEEKAERAKWADPVPV